MEFLSYRKSLLIRDYRITRVVVLLAKSLVVGIVFSSILIFGRNAFATPCMTGSCGGEGESCWINAYGYYATCAVGVTPPGGVSCACDSPNHCNEATMICEQCNAEGDTCCAGSKCDLPYTCNTSTNTCVENKLDCNNIGESCCIEHTTQYCDNSILNGSPLTCGPSNTCIYATEHTDAECLYGRVSGGAEYYDCCDEVGEACCGNAIPPTYCANTSLKCNYSGQCALLGSAESCGVIGKPCCTTATGYKCFEGNVYNPNVLTCNCVGDTPPADVEYKPILPYSGPRITNIAALLAPIFKILFYAGLLVGILGIIYSGYLFISSEGDPGRVKEGKDQFTAAILGTLFVLLSVFILRVIIRNILGVDTAGF